jgi:putative DNA primase/helicase
VFRVIEAHCPTLLIDEADSFMKENEELRGVINSGHTRQSAYVIRTVGDDHEPRQFSTWGAKAISGIGHLAGTLMDRAIVANLRRKLPTEKCCRLRHADPGTFTHLASRLARFAEDAGPAMGQARPELPEALNDRTQDNWEPLLAIADHAQGQWPKLARDAALKLSGSEHEPVSTTTELLADIKEIFESKKVDKLATADLREALIADDLKPWGSYAYGKPITPRQLGKRLGEFGIESQDIKFNAAGNVVKKGYRLGQFKDVFERYLAAPPSTPPIHPLPATFEQQSAFTGSGKVAVADSSATDSSATRLAQVAEEAGRSGRDADLRIDGRRAV